MGTSHEVSVRRPVSLVRDAAAEVVAAQGRLLEPLAPRAPGEAPLRMVTVGAVSGGVFAMPGAFEGDTVAIVEAPIVRAQPRGVEQGRC